MPDPSVIAVVVIVGAVALAAAWRPERAVMALGVFLFVQSAFVRVDAIPVALRDLLGRLDEVVIASLVVRFLIAGAMGRRLVVPASLWAVLAFGLVGVASLLVNGVPMVAGSVGLFLAIKGGLWLFVALQLRYDRRVVVRYVAVIGALFAAAIGVAVLQFAGVTLPWDPRIRRSGELAATSIWNQHTVFGSALAMSAGVSVLLLRIPTWRPYGLGLAVASGIGAVLSTARRLFISVPAAALALFLALSGPFATWAAGGLEMFRIMADTWDEYVVHASTRDRYELYRGGFDLAVRSPLLGRGPGTFGSYASVLFNSPAYAELGIRLPDTLKMGAPYASLLGEFGILGVATFASFLWLTVRPLIPLAGHTDATVARAMASAAIFLLADAVIESVVHVTFSDSLGSFIAFGAAGAALSLARAPDAEAVPAPAPERQWVLLSLAGAALLMLMLIGLVGLLEG